MKRQPRLLYSQELQLNKRQKGEKKKDEQKKSGQKAFATRHRGQFGTLHDATAALQWIALLVLAIQTIFPHF